MPIARVDIILFIADRNDWRKITLSMNACCEFFSWPKFLMPPWRLGWHLDLLAFHRGVHHVGGWLCCYSYARCYCIERFYATRPENHTRKLSGRKLKLVIAGAWIFAILTEVPPLSVMTYDNKSAKCNEKWSRQVHGKIYTTFTFIVDFAISLILMAVLYFKTVKALWGRSTDKSHSCASGDKKTQTRDENRHHRYGATCVVLAT